MPKQRARVQFATGWAEFDLMDDVRVGDRMVPGVIDVHLPSADDLPALMMRIEVRRGVPVCTEVTIRATPTGREVRTSDLRAVHIEDWLEAIVAAASGRIVAEQDGTVTTTYSAGESAHREAVQTIRRARRATRRRITDDLKRHVAEIYLDNRDSGRPVKAVQDAFGTSYRTAARYIQAAQTAGFLSASDRPGRKA